MISYYFVISLMLIFLFARFPLIIVTRIYFSFKKIIMFLKQPLIKFSTYMLNPYAKPSKDDLLAP